MILSFSCGRGTGGRLHFFPCLSASGFVPLVDLHSVHTWYGWYIVVTCFVTHKPSHIPEFRVICIFCYMLDHMFTLNYTILLKGWLQSMSMFTSIFGEMEVLTGEGINNFGLKKRKSIR